MKNVMTKVMAVVMIAALLAGVFAFGAGAESNKIRYMKTTAKCNIRISPNKSAEQIGTAKKGEVYAYDRTKTDKRGVKWYGIIYGSYGTAWISSRNAVKCTKNGKVDPTKKPTAKPTKKPAATPKPIDYSKFQAADGKVLVTGSSVYMRFEPSTDSSKIGAYTAGTILRAIRTNGSWMEVLDEETGRAGYMSCKYLQTYVEPEPEEAMEEEAAADVHSGIVNSFEELQAAVPNAVLIDVPAGSTNVVYSWIDVDGLKNTIAEIAFEYQGIDVDLRASACDTAEAAEAIDGVTIEDDHDETTEEEMHMEISEDGNTAVVHYFSEANATQYSLSGPAIADGSATMALAEQLFK